MGKNRFCLDCGKALVGRGNRSQRCEDCQTRHRNDYFSVRYDIKNPRNTKRRRERKKETTGSQPPILGGLPPFIHLVNFANKCWVDENGEPQDIHTQARRNTQVDQDETTLTTVITEQGNITHQWDHELTPGRITEMNSSVTNEDPTGRVEEYRRWAYWRRLGPDGDVTMKPSLDQLAGIEPEKQKKASQQEKKFYL